MTGTGFRKYSKIGKEIVPSTNAAEFRIESSKFRENQNLVIGYSFHGSGPDVAVFNYGYFGDDLTDSNGGSRSGGGSSGGGYKLAEDSRVNAPSPFKGMN